MLDITMQLDISTMLTLQVTTIICHNMKKVLLKKKKKIWGNLTKIHILTKTIHR